MNHVVYATNEEGDIELFNITKQFFAWILKAKMEFRFGRTIQRIEMFPNRVVIFDAGLGYNNLQSLLYDFPYVYIPAYVIFANEE